MNYIEVSFVNFQHDVHLKIFGGAASEDGKIIKIKKMKKILWWRRDEN